MPVGVVQGHDQPRHDGLQRPVCVEPGRVRIRGLCLLDDLVHLADHTRSHLEESVAARCAIADQDKARQRSDWNPRAATQVLKRRHRVKARVLGHFASEVRVGVVGRPYRLIGFETQGDESAAGIENRLVAHWITSSARPSTDGGIVRPRASAVLGLMTSSNFVGCSMGRSAGLAPLRIKSATLCRIMTLGYLSRYSPAMTV